MPQPSSVDWKTLRRGSRPPVPDNLDEIIRSLLSSAAILTLDAPGTAATSSTTATAATGTATSTALALMAWQWLLQPEEVKKWHRTMLSDNTIAPWIVAVSVFVIIEFLFLDHVLHEDDSSLNLSPLSSAPEPKLAQSVRAGDTDGRGIAPKKRDGPGRTFFAMAIYLVAWLSGRARYETAVQRALGKTLRSTEEELEYLKRFAHLEKQNLDLETKAAERDALLARLRDMVQTFKREGAEQAYQFTAKETEIADLKRTLENVQNETTALRTELAERISEFGKKDDKITHRTRSLDIAKSVIESPRGDGRKCVDLEATNKKLQRRVEEQASELETLAAAHEDLQAKLATRTRERDEAKSELGDETRRGKDVFDQLAEVAESEAALKDDKKRRDGAVENLRRELRNARAEAEREKRAKERADVELECADEVFRQKLRDARELLHASRAEVAGWQQQNAEAEEACGRARDGEEVALRERDGAEKILARILGGGAMDGLVGGVLSECMGEVVGEWRGDGKTTGASGGGEPEVSDGVGAAEGLCEV